MKFDRFLIVVLLGAVALIAAGCSSSGESNVADTLPEPTEQSSTSSSTSSTSTSTTSTTSTTAAPKGPSELALSPVAVPDPDPKLTVIHLESVLVEAIDGFIIATFDQSLFELNAGIVDGDDNRIDCWNPLDDSGDARCSVFHADGTGSGEAYPLGDIELTDEQIALPAVVSASDGTITITVEGEDYSSPKITFMDGPVMVQIDINSGGFANAVTRVMGEATAKDLSAALG